MEDVKAGKRASGKAGESGVVLCPLMQGPCTAEKCAAWELIPEGQACPISLEPAALEAIKQAAVAAAKYADEILDIDAFDERYLLEKVVESISEGKIDFARLVRDTLKLG